MSEGQSNLATALLAAQEEMPAVERDAENPHFGSKFTSLGKLLSTARPVLNKHGLSLVQAPALADGAFVLRTTILHKSGESMEFDAPLSPTKNDPQSQGSAITYMRRYSLASALAIADQEDDDGNAAGRSNGNSLPAASSDEKKELAAALESILPKEEAEAAWGKIKQEFGGELVGSAARAVIAVISAKKALDE